MDRENCLGAIIMACCCFGCWALFFTMGILAIRAKKPAHFWAGTVIDTDRVSNLQGYNCACGIMWKIYAVPYFLAGILSCFGIVGDGYIIAAAIFLFLSFIPGALILIRHYKKIEEAYIIK